MKRIFIIIAAALVAAFPLRADEGMWLPALISQRIEDMQAKGFKLTAEDLYSINQASLKDAVVLFGSGCTGELVSAEGLLLTNHHCGYSWIQKHSSVEHDYLKDGFWAMNRSEELPDPGLTVSFLERMEDVTALIESGKTKEEIIAEATAEGNGLEAEVDPLYYTNQYFLFVFRKYRDVRLVGAPPSSIGKFGGDTDNWMWPRHTGDFSIFRVYADKNNNPADYSEDNVPYTPKKFLKISRKGVQEGDFTMVYGFPGSTKEYVHSQEVKYIAEVSDPARIAIRTLRLDIQQKYMSASQAVRIQYSSKRATVANAWKKWQGEIKGLVKNDIVSKKREFEAAFSKWAEGTEYEGLTDKFESLYAELEPYAFAKDIYQETAYAVEIAQFAGRSSSMDEARKAEYSETFYKDYYQPIDKESFIAIMAEFDKYVSDELKPEYFKSKIQQFSSFEAWAEEIFGDSLAPAEEFYKEFYKWYTSDIAPVVSDINKKITALYKDYMRARMEFEKDRAFYPDANLTLRIAYGHVEGYAPADGIYYYPVSTLKGVMEKDNPDIFDYNIPQVLRDVYARGDCEDTPVCFLATNHTTGGNSGSPVLNADGDLIGLNFDRVWEGTMSDLAFDPEICRNISLDIRYLLFITEKIGGAYHLLDEMTFAE